MEVSMATYHYNAHFGLDDLNLEEALTPLLDGHFLHPRDPHQDYSSGSLEFNFRYQGFGLETGVDQHYVHWDSATLFDNNGQVPG